MAWTYDQSSGELTLGGKFVSVGYSGKGRGKNNPSLQGVAGIGPIPQGEYDIKAPYDSKNVGPYAMPLYARDKKPGNDTFEEYRRGAFRIHGDSIKAPGTASKGCVILPRAIRERIWKSGDHILIVKE